MTWVRGGGGRDPSERALLQFQGAVGGPSVSLWEAGLRVGVGYAVDTTISSSTTTTTSGSMSTNTTSSSSQPPPPSNGITSSNGNSGSMAIASTPSTPSSSSMYPQPMALGPALLAVQTKLLGSIIRATPVGGKTEVLDALLGVAQGYGTATGVGAARKDKDAAKRMVAILASSAPVIAGLSSTGGAPIAPDPEAAQKILSMAQVATAEAAVNGAVVVQRCTAGLFAAASRLSTDAVAVQLINSLCREAAATASLSQRAAFALAIGAVSRLVGGLGLGPVLPLTVNTLAALAEASDSSIVPVVLHALITCSQAAGLSFVPHVRSTLVLAQKMLLSQDIYVVHGLLPAVGRLANAMVAALGPDYVLGSASYDACRSVVAELRAPDASGVRRPQDALAASLQSVLYAQMLVLFAPRALPTAQHVAVLVSTLPSRQPQLRKAAADTLRHLAERDAESVLAERIEPALLAALDGETDPATATQLQATLTTLLMAGAAQQPSRWISLCSEIIAAANPTDLSSSKSGADLLGSGGGGGENDADTDDDGLASSSGAAVSSGLGAHSSAGTTTPPRPRSKHAPAIPDTPSTPSIMDQHRQQTALTPRLRTRVFAARCMLQLPGLAAAADPRHTNLILAQQSNSKTAAGPAAAAATPLPQDWLILRLQSLVDLGFKMSTGQMDALRSLGVDLMLAVLTHLGDCPDPLAEEINGNKHAKLLTQYQAQYVSTLRASLAPEASPAVAAAGSALAASFLEKGLAAGDAVVMERMMGLLCAPLSAWASGAGVDAAQATYAEWVGARARVALLESHAHCAALVAASGDDPDAKAIVVRTQGPHLTLLVDCWIGMLSDYSLLQNDSANTLERAIDNKYRLSLYGKGPASAKAPLFKVVAKNDTFVRALKKAWPVVLEAASFSLTNDRTVSYGGPGKERHAALMDACFAAAAGWVQHALPSTTAPPAENNNSQNSNDTSNTAIVVETYRGQYAPIMRALQRLTAPRFSKEGWLTTGAVKEGMAVTSCALDVGTDGIVYLSVVESASAVIDNVSCVLPAVSSTTHDDADMEAMFFRCVDLCLQHFPPLARHHPTSAEGIITVLLSALSNRLAAAATSSNGSHYVSVLHRCFSVPLSFLAPQGASSTSLAQSLTKKQASVILTALVSAAKNTTSVSLNYSSPSATAVDVVLSAAVATAAQQIVGLCSMHSDGANESTYSVALGANIAAALALGAWAGSGTELQWNSGGGDGTEMTSEAVNGTTLPMENNDSVEEEDDDEWGDAEFASATTSNTDTTTTTTTTTNAAVFPSFTFSASTSPAQTLCLEALRDALSSPNMHHALSALRAVTSYLTSSPPAPPLWASALSALSLPLAFARLHALLRAAATEHGIQDGIELEYAVEALQCGVAVCRVGGAVGATAMPMVVAMMVESAEGVGSVSATLPLSEAAVKLFMSLASDQMTAVQFKGAVAGLSDEGRQRLQRALARVASKNSPSPGTGTGIGQNRREGLTPPPPPQTTRQPTGSVPVLVLPFKKIQQQQ